MAVHHVPQGLASLIPQLVTPEAERLITFLEDGFGARVMTRMPGPDGKGVMHSSLSLEGLALFVAGPFGPAPVTRSNLMLYVPDVDATVQRAVKAGAKIAAPVADQPWGDRWGMIEDPAGNLWQIATHKEDLSGDEIMRRMKAAMG